MVKYLIMNLRFQSTKLKKPQLIQKLIRILGKGNPDWDCETFDAASVQFLEEHLHRGTVSGNLFYMLNTFIDEPYDDLPDILLAGHLINEIMEHKDEIYRNIEKKCK